MNKRIVASIAVTAASITVLAACSSSNSTGNGNTPSNNSGTGAISVPGSTGQVYPAASGTETAGTITWAEQPNSGPTWIFPITAAGENSVFNIYTFSWEMWRPVYWTIDGVTGGVNQAMSLADLPVYSNGDKTVSVTFKNTYKWSDGTPVTADDLMFDIDMIKAGLKLSPANWSGYVPGNFPDNLASMSETNPQTLVINLTSPVNPTWFTDDVLSQGPMNPLPAQAWAKTSASGPVVTNWKNNLPVDEKIFSFLTAQNKDVNTYATNPLWQVVDGPYKLSAYNASNQGYTMTPNPTYGGPHAAKMSVFQAIPFTSDAAEFNAVKAGQIDVALIDTSNFPQLPTLSALGYKYFGIADFGFNAAFYNFQDKTGDFNNIVDKLYFREALEHLENQQGWIHAYMNGYGSPDYGPVPEYPRSQYLPADATSNPYPFSVADAVSLLKSNGWTINAGGTDVCSKPGTGTGECGAGIPAGTKLAFNFIYSTSPTLIGQQATDLVSQASQAGIHITLQSSNFDYMLENYVDPAAPANDNKWAIEDFGGEGQNAYPTTFGTFNTGGGGQIGDYDDPTANSLINASVSSSNPAAVENEASYLTKDLPVLWQPNQDWVWTWKSDISGSPESFESLTQFYATPEFWYFTK